jgi:hypothetical protein
MKTRYAALFLVATVALAGCAGSATSGIDATTTTDEDVETTDGVETTTDEQTADLPPGVNESGIENGSRLLEANRQALAESGYAFRLVWTNTDEAEYDSRTVSHGTVAKEFAPYRIRTESELRYDNQTSRAETDVWGNESVALAEYEELNRTSYQKYVNEPNGTARASPFEMSWIHGLSGQLSHDYVTAVAVRTGEYEVESVERRDGLTLTTLRATEPHRTLGERDAQQVSDYDATLVVDECGRIHRANLTIVFSESTFSYDFELTAVGGVVVAYPPWADRALATENATTPATTAGEPATTANESAKTAGEPTTTAAE